MRTTLHRLAPVLPLLLFLAPIPPRSVSAAPPVFAHKSSDLPPDRAAVWGCMPNGLRYVVMPNREPKERASLRLVVGSGSLHETEEQRGLAHFLEHMAFNGSAHYPPGTLVEYFQRLGMSFGGDTNAYTSFDATVYMIDLPDTATAAFQEAFQVFTDYAGGLLLDPGEIDRERDIILSEKRTRDSVEYRTYVAEGEFLLGESLFPRRMPIGTVEVITGASRATFADFYDAWYRPDNIAVVAVGDFDPAVVETQIKETFGSFAARAPARPQPDLGRIPDAPGLHVGFHAEPEASRVTVSIQTMTPWAGEPDTAANRLERLPRELALSMLNRRLSILAKKEGAPFTSGRADVNESYKFYRNASIELTCRTGPWQGALATAEQELRRALEHGFQPAELREAVDHFRNDLDQAAKRAPTRRSDQLAGNIVDCLRHDRVLTHPETDLALFEPALKKVSIDDCLRALREAWNVDRRHVFVTGNIDFGPESAGAEDAIAAVYEKSRAAAVAPPEKIAEEAFAYADFGPAGAVTRHEHVGDLDVDLIEFANGVRLNLKRTDFEAHTIRLSIRIGAGKLVEPAAQPGLAFAANLTFVIGGLGRHGVDDLQRLFAGKTVGLDFRVRDDALTLAGSTNREDLLAQLQLLTAFIVDPGYRPEALRQAEKVIDQIYTRFAHTPAGPLQTDVPCRLAGGDPRFGLPAREVVMGRTLDEVRAWLAPQLADGAIEVAVVGDFDTHATMAAVAQTLGALPKRSIKPGHVAEREASFPVEPFAMQYAVPTEIPKGVVSLYWPTADARDVTLVRRLNLLAEIFSDRLRVKVREEMGGAYDLFAGNTSSETYTDYGFLSAQATVDPPQTQAIADAIVGIAADLWKNGVTEDELDRARKPILTSLRESARTNPYWLNTVIGACQEFPQRLDWCRTRYSYYEGVTSEQINELAAFYLDSARVFRVIILPENAK